MQLSCPQLLWQHSSRAVLLSIGRVGSPDRSFRLVVATKRDDRTEHIGMVQGDIHGTKAPHRETSDGTVRGIRDRAIVLINILDEIDGDEGLHQQAVIVAVSPLATGPTATVAIRRDQDDLRDLPAGNQRISRLTGLPGGEPVAFPTGKAM